MDNNQKKHHQYLFISAPAPAKMKDRKNKYDVACSRFFCFLVLSCLTLSTFRLFPSEMMTMTAWRTRSILRVISGNSPVFPEISVRETVEQPDQKMFFLSTTSHYHVRRIKKDGVDCVYTTTNSSQPEIIQPPAGVEADNPDNIIIRCPLLLRGATVSIALKSLDGLQRGPISSGPEAHKWNSLAYDALIDRDNSTIVFVKGLNLRPEKVYNASRFECVYGWDFTTTRFLLRSDVVSAAQEIVRCKTPLSILNRPQRISSSVTVSVRVKGKEALPSVARPDTRPVFEPVSKRPHEVCVCTMARNQGRFLKEWVMYHARIGVQRWFVYDNNSNDDTSEVIELLSESNYNITRHAWPWIKTQEAGFAHCALRAHDKCEWVGFIDVDEFFHSPFGFSLPDITQNQSGSIGEIRTACHNFGPSGQKEAPREGVTAGYACRVALLERHKSMVRPEALSLSLVNVVHHFHLREGFRYRNLERGTMVVNHYKYQVWSVFKEKFYRRVATYVADWQDEVNAGSRDRAPGLGFKAVQPEDWSGRFCEVWDTGLKNRVVQMFADPETHLFPWQEEEEQKMKNLNSTIRRQWSRRKRCH